MPLSLHCSKLCPLFVLAALVAVNLTMTTVASFRGAGGRWQQQAKLLPDDGVKSDAFGSSVAICGNTALVGALRHDDNGLDSGSAYVFRYDGSTWVQEAKLLPDDGAAGDLFGRSVAVSGNAALIGAVWDDDNGNNSGSAYVFRYDGSEWLQEAKLLPDDGAAGDVFGNSVAICGNTAVVAAVFNDDNGNNSGSAYAFRYDGSTWLQQVKLLPDDGWTNDQFGRSVALSVNTALVGAWYDDDNGSASGSAYVFRFNGLIWVQEAKLLSDDGTALDQFGYSVAVSGNTAAVGALNHMGIQPGTAYVFRFDGSRWVQEAKLPPTGAPFGFGRSVAVFSSTAVVGAHSGHGNEPFSGSAYVFCNHGSTWVQEAKLLADDGAAGDFFGGRIALSGNTAVVGASGDDDACPDDPDCNSGSAYVFTNLIPGDLDGDGVVGILDLLALLSAWGPCAGECPADLDGDGAVGVLDLLTLLANWGSCA